MANNVYSVKQVNAYIKNMFAQDYMLSRIYVAGEVSNCKYHSSGHLYFSLKDESGTIACVMFAGQRGGLSFRMEEGQQVIVFGEVNVYERAGVYQLYANEIRLDGEGVLYEKFTELKKQLEEMGMFDARYKRDLPFYPKRIGIVTAPTGAAIRDIINIATRRNPGIALILYPAKVQGEGARDSIVRGIELLNEKNVDVIIVGRGGGSIEDLWAFNEENVARAIFNSEVPIISAVGHETDTTISDYVADMRAPTPSAAAELAVPDVRLLQGSMEEYRMKILRSMNQSILIARLRHKETLTRLKYLHPLNKLRQQQQYLQELSDNLKDSMLGKLREQRHRLAINVEMMKGLSPLKKLNQGYAYIEDRDKKPIKSIEKLCKGDEINIFLGDGKIKAEILALRKEQYGSEKGKP